jgi:hypothetical protein
MSTHSHKSMYCNLAYGHWAGGSVTDKMWWEVCSKDVQPYLAINLFVPTHWLASVFRTKFKKHFILLTKQNLDHDFLQQHPPTYPPFSYLLWFGFEISGIFVDLLNVVCHAVVDESHRRVCTILAPGDLSNFLLLFQERSVMILSFFSCS